MSTFFVCFSRILGLWGILGCYMDGSHRRKRITITKYPLFIIALFPLGGFGILLSLCGSLPPFGAFVSRFDISLMTYGCKCGIPMTYVKLNLELLMLYSDD